MSDIENVRKYEYRPCRIATGFFVDFVVIGNVLHGFCRDVSDDGIRASLDGSLSVGISGLLSLHLPTGELKLEAKVAYSEGGQVGLIFLFKSPWERGVTVECIAQVANHTGDSQVVPFP